MIKIGSTAHVGMSTYLLFIVGSIALLGAGCSNEPAANGAGGNDGAGGRGGALGQDCAGGDFVPRPTCEAFCATAVTECSLFPTPADVCGEICECQLEAGTEFAESCAAAWEIEYACAAELDCDEFLAYISRLGDDFPCYREAIATDDECGAN